MSQAEGTATRRRIQLQEQEVDYLLLRSGRRSIGLRIDDEGLRVTAPRRASLAMIDHALLSRQRWILDKLQMRRELASQRAASPPQWRDGMSLPYLGQPLKLRLASSPPAASWHCRDSGSLFLDLAPGAGAEHVASCAQSWLQDQAGLLLEERLRWHAARMGLRYHAFSLTSARTRWGSCSASGHIRLNWRLVHLELFLIDYVAVHELAHLREMNHSPRFWAVVAAAFPAYAEARKRLRRESPGIFSLFPPSA